MKELNRAIHEFGKSAGKDVVKVDMFLNHRIDTALMFKMGECIAEHFSLKKPDIILTVEASGIALAITAAHALNDIPVVFAKKSATVVQNDTTAQAHVYSFTHKTDNIIRVEKHYLPENSNVLIVDDFLADGQAVNGMLQICREQNCSVCGVGIGIEKGFQEGGKKLRNSGIDLFSLAVVKKIEDGNIILEDD